jgi:hypothetical protein
MYVKIDDDCIIHFYSGVRSEKPLTESQKSELIEYAVQLGMSSDLIKCSDIQQTHYKEKHDYMLIGTDVMPLENAKSGVRNANQRVSGKATIAHEIVGHRAASLKNKMNVNDVYEEVQASIRAARFAKGLTEIERLVLLEDARSRLPKNVRLKDIRHLLYIDME